MYYICTALKRILTIPLLFLYIIAISGVMIQLHYCGQELESWQMFAENAGCADDGCGDESTENDGCCKDEVVIAKINQDQNTASQLVLKLMAVQAISPVYHDFHIENISAAKAGILTHSPNAPPGRWQGIPLYKLHSSFTYYG